MAKIRQIVISCFSFLSNFMDILNKFLEHNPCVEGSQRQSITSKNDLKLLSKVCHSVPLYYVMKLCRSFVTMTVVRCIIMECAYPF